MAYDPDNIFAKILRGDIPANKPVYEDDYVLAFWDIAPKKQTHVLIIPKGSYADITSFSKEASDEEILALIRAIPKVVEKLGLAEKGYRLISNCRDHGGQEVPHLHLHILGGEPVGAMVNS